MGRTEKVGSVGRFGARYGRSIKRRVLDVEREQLAKHNCPKCGFPKVHRLGMGIFSCKKCGVEFAGGAYTPSTLSGRLISKMVMQKQFAPYLGELIQTTEAVKSHVREAAGAEQHAGKPAEAISGKKHAAGEGAQPAAHASKGKPKKPQEKTELQGKKAELAEKGSGKEKKEKQAYKEKKPKGKATAALSKALKGILKKG